MYERHSNFNSIFEKASNATGLQIGIFKAICAIESDFDFAFKTYKEPRKYGLFGLTEYATAQVSKSMQDEYGLIGPVDLLDPKINIAVGANIIRYLYFRLDNPNLLDVIVEFAKLNASFTQEYVNKVWRAYFYFSQLPGEPQSSSPNEVPGVDIRKQQQQVRYL